MLEKSYFGEDCDMLSSLGPTELCPHATTPALLSPTVTSTEGLSTELGLKHAQERQPIACVLLDWPTLSSGCHSCPFGLEKRSKSPTGCCHALLALSS